MTLVVLTYDAPHRKTEDVVWRLMTYAAGEEIRLIGTPWETRKPRRYIYAHRPGEPPWPAEPSGHPAVLYARMGLCYTLADKQRLLDELRSLAPRVVIVGGAGILARDVVEEFPVLNVHPGLLPQCRGLDILKWSLMENLRVGVTAHIVDDRADLGWRVLDRVVPVYAQDTFHAFAARQYEYEIALLGPALEAVLKANCDREAFSRIEPSDTESRRRMPREVEAGLLAAFERYKLVWAEA
jgi:phosphoribosylglycinamide formyltransferase-1